MHLSVNYDFSSLKHILKGKKKNMLKNEDY